jgi:hypothetical protein
MFKEKFLPASYYDILLFTDVQITDDENDLPVYEFITRRTKMYPEARSSDLYKASEIRVPNNLQDVLTRLRKVKGIKPAAAAAAKKATA